MLFKKKVVWVTVIVASFSFNYAHAEYVEGIDTTDVDGYGLDSIFQIKNSRINETDKSLQIIYYCIEGDIGYFHYSFDDLTMAPLAVKKNRTPDKYLSSFFSYCVIVQALDSTWVKIKVVEECEENRFIFKWGRNTSPNKAYLVDDEYDRSGLFKPNNLHMWYNYDLGEGTNGVNANDTISWEPPLPNDNHLIGYIFYLERRRGTIDTTAPINLSQWDLTFVSDSVCKIPCEQWSNRYFNLVAIYQEGRSDFLEGWTCNFNPAFNIDTTEQPPNRYAHKKNAFNGLFISEYRTADISVFNILGRQVRYINEAKMGSADGRYILKTKFPDRSVVTQPFTVIR